MNSRLVNNAAVAYGEWLGALLKCLNIPSFLNGKPTKNDDFLKLLLRWFVGLLVNW